MIIGFDAKRYFQNTTGLGNYSRTLINSLVERFPEEMFHLYSPRAERRDLRGFEDKKPQNFKIYTPEGAIKGGIWRTFYLGKTLGKHNVDLFHGLSHEIPLRAEVPCVVTMHDTISLDFPELYPPVDRFIYKQKMAYACKNASHIIAISQATKERIMHHFSVEDSAISVVYQGIAPHFTRLPDRQEQLQVAHRHHLPEKYILSVGSVIERKRLLPAIEAFSRLKDETIHFVVVGKGKEYLTKVRSFVRSKGLENRVHFLNEVKNEELPVLYHLAQVFVYPSVSEGFGIPLLEAFSQQVPVITSRFSCLPEVSGKVALEIDPDVPEEFDQALQTALYDNEFRKTAVLKGAIRFNFFQEGDPAAQMMEIYRATLQSR